MQEIRRLRVLGLNKHDIMRTMNLSRHCYEDRVYRMNKIDEEYVLNNFHNELGTEIICLQETLRDIVRISTSIATDPKIQASDRLEALESRFHASISLYKLFNEGPHAISQALKDSIILIKERYHQHIDHDQSKLSLLSSSQHREEEEEQITTEGNNNNHNNNDEHLSEIF
jgi:hypothetical protein